jgi:hypothetical protein
VAFGFGDIPGPFSVVGEFACGWRQGPPPTHVYLTYTLVRHNAKVSPSLPLIDERHRLVMRLEFVIDLADVHNNRNAG